MTAPDSAAPRRSADEGAPAGREVTSPAPPPAPGTVNGSLGALLHGLIDYAGLFPPASLTMTEAVARYAAYRGGAQAWMLGRFIVPCARLAELEAAAAPHWEAGTNVPWRISAIAAGDLIGGDLAADRAAIEAFNARHGEAVATIDAVEVKMTPGVDVEALGSQLSDRLTMWVEVTPGPSVGATLAALAESGHGAKLRTGGVTPELIPSSAAVAQVLLGCARAGVRLKATAGLHHPVRASHRLTYADDSPTAVMHGFLNVFLAAALARDLVLHAYPDPEAQATIVSLLDETSARAFTWHDDHVRWRQHRVSVSTLRDVRERAARSFGSCSFDEPVADLRLLGLLR